MLVPGNRMPLKNMNKFKKFLNNKNPGSGLYIFVWFVAISATNIVVTLIDSYFAITFINSVSDLTFQLILTVSSIETIIFVAIMIFVYKKFPNIKISKVAVWYYVLTFVGTARNFSQIKDDLEGVNVGFDIGAISILLICLWIAHCLIFRQYFRKTKQW